jgi:hypothetical protein
MINFDAINDWIRDTETAVVNVISAIAPWLAPIAPAYMTYQHAVGVLNFPVWVALPVAIVVEILGFSAVSTFMSFLFFNRRNKASSKKAPVGFVVFAFFFYLALIVTSNVLLDTFDNAEWAVNTVRALFTLQTIPAVLIVVSRAGHNSLLAEIESEKKLRTNDRTLSESADTKADNDRPMSAQKRTKSELTAADWKIIATSSTEKVALTYGCDERTARRWRKDAQDTTSPPFP